MAVRLLVLTVVAHALLAAHGQSGSGSAEDTCNAPDPRPNPPDLRNVDAAVMESRCHLVCVERISMQEGITIEPSLTYPAWPVLPNSVLQRNCSIYKMVQMCRKGCTFRNNETCITKCHEEECDTANPNNCQICNQGSCMTGCDVMHELEIIQNQTHAPPPPVGPLALSLAEGYDGYEYFSDAGLYNIDPTNAIPTEQSSEERYPTVIVIRARDINQGPIYYIWMTSFEEILNLTTFACREVRIQLGAVNKFGLDMSHFSYRSSLSVDVYGESPPTYASHPDKLHISVMNDTRPGFWKHAVIEVSWKRPRKGFEVLDHYEVVFKLATLHDQPYCKPKDRVFIVNKTSSDHIVKLTIRADSFEEGPVSNCRYTVQVKSVSIDPNVTPPPADYDNVHITSSETMPVPLNFKCNRTWDDKTGNFTYKLDWTVPSDMNVQRAISSFVVTVDVVSPDGTTEQLSSTPYPFIMNQSIDYHHSQLVRYDRPHYIHRIMMTSNPGDPSLIVLVPAPRVCRYEAEPVVPEQVVNVRADVKEVKVLRSSISFNLAVTWTPALTGPGHYQLRIVEEKNNTTPCMEDCQETYDTHAVITGLKITSATRRSCLYVQVKAVNGFMAEGPWSESVCVDLSSLTSLPVNTALPTTAQGSVSGDDNGEVVYIAVSVFLLLLVSVAILAVVVCIAYYPVHKNKNKLRRVNTVFMTRKASDKDKYTAGKLDQWEVYSNQVAIQSQLGEGAFGHVYRGLFNSTITDKSNAKKKFDVNNSVVVAVKLLRDDAPDKDRQIFLKHILQAKKVAQYQNPHLVCLVGCVTEQEPLSLLTEYPEQGDLLTFLRAQRHEIYQTQLQFLDFQDGVSGHQLPTIMPQYSSEQSLQAQDLMLFISHVAAGLEHLASIGVVHGDVACRNLFLTANKVVKIADFGLDSISEEENGLIYMKSELGRLPIRWMAIESIRDGEFSTSSDVWAFGITLWEIASIGGFPYHDTANGDILATLSAGQRLRCPTNCSEEIYGIMLKCCAASPNDRPSFSTLHHVFKSLHTTANDVQYITLNIDRTNSYYLASPRSSTAESHTLTDDCALLMEQLEANPVEVAIIKQPHTSGEIYTNHPPPVIQHSQTASYSETGFLPCITEEGEDVSDNDEEAVGEEGKREASRRDSGNDSTFSHESGKEQKDSDRDDLEESLVAPGAMEGVDLP